MWKLLNKCSEYCSRIWLFPLAWAQDVTVFIEHQAAGYSGGSFENASWDKLKHIPLVWGFSELMCIVSLSKLYHFDFLF